MLTANWVAAMAGCEERRPDSVDFVSIGALLFLCGAMLAGVLFVTYNMAMKNQEGRKGGVSMSDITKYEESKGHALGQGYSASAANAEKVDEALKQADHSASHIKAADINDDGMRDGPDNILDFSGPLVTKKKSEGTME